MTQLWIVADLLFRTRRGQGLQCGEIRRGALILFMLVIFKPLLLSNAIAAELTKPVRNGVLTDSWGPTLGTVGGSATPL